MQELFNIIEGHIKMKASLDYNKAAFELNSCWDNILEKYNDD